MIDFPTPDTKYPLLKGLERTCFLKDVVKNKNIIIGDYTYYDDIDGNIYNFEKNVIYHYDFLGDKLIIGKFCQIASCVRFLMNGIFHMIDSISTFPFSIFSNYISQNFSKKIHYPNKGDTVIGNDVWIGYNATFMPGVHVGDGAIIGANANITKNVPPYSIVGGNPAKLIRYRFNENETRDLLEIKWWDWDIEKILENVDVIMSSNVNKLRSLA